MKNGMKYSYTTWSNPKGIVLGEKKFLEKEYSLYDSTYDNS